MVINCILSSVLQELDNALVLDRYFGVHCTTVADFMIYHSIYTICVSTTMVYLGARMLFMPLLSITERFRSKGER